jgi:hypothetical protein
MKTNKSAFSTVLMTIYLSALVITALSGCDKLNNYGKSFSVTYDGNCNTGGHADGTGAAASFKMPVGIVTDGTDLYVADSRNNEIRRIR